MNIIIKVVKKRNLIIPFSIIKLKTFYWWFKKKFVFLIDLIILLFKFFLQINSKYPQNISVEEAKKKISNLKPDNGENASNFINPTINDNYDLTIIIPVFNANDYLYNCLDSILNQKTKYKYKLLIMDDGSTDDSLKTLYKYKQFKNIIIFHQENCGQAAARNRMLEYADSKFLMFVDADDILIDGAIDKLMNIMIETDCDIGEGKVISFINEKALYNDYKSLNTYKTVINSNRKNPYHVLSCNGYSPAKIYKRKLWDNIRYPEGYIFEDTVIKFVVRRLCKKHVYTDQLVYGYRYNYNSTTRNGDAIRYLDALWVLFKILDICNNLGIKSDETLYFLMINYLGILMVIITHSLSKDIQKSVLLIGRDLLISYSEYKPKEMPLLFRMLIKAILDVNYKNWQLLGGFLSKYPILKKWREIN